jgi:two-component system, NtrC family, response regulator HydG
MIEQAAALSPGREIREADIEVDQPRVAAVAPDLGAPGATLAEAVEDAERRAIAAALARCAGDLGRVARELGVSGTTLWRKMKRLGIEGRGAAPLE